MAIQYIKKGIDEKKRSEDNEKVKKVVEQTLKKIELEGDKYIRELSEKFDNYSPKSFKLSDSEIQNLISEVSDDDIKDIPFVTDVLHDFKSNIFMTNSFGFGGTNASMIINRI